MKYHSYQTRNTAVSTAWSDLTLKGKRPWIINIMYGHGEGSPLQHDGEREEY